MADLKLPGLNSVIIAGRIVHNAETRYTSTGAGITEFSIACDEYYKAGDESKKKTHFFSVNLWNAKEALLGELLQGRAVVVEGKMTQETWDDKTTGKKAEKIRITANRVQMLDWANKKGSDVPF